MCAVAFLSILQVCWPAHNCPAVHSTRVHQEEGLLASKPGPSIVIPSNPSILFP